MLPRPRRPRARSRVSSCLPHCRRPRSARCPLAHAPLRVRCCPVRHPALNSGTAFPKELQAYLHDYNVLLLDVRNRADFEKAHIRTEAVICVEPIISGGRGLTAEHGEHANERDDDVQESGQVRPDRRVRPVFADARGAEDADLGPGAVDQRDGVHEAAEAHADGARWGSDAWRREVGEQGTAAAKAPSPAAISFQPRVRVRRRRLRRWRRRPCRMGTVR
ncbi:hypothetical protein B0H14DRAFT_161653 [Mycena olivaceomarginata]|nr:hypothetical protein B0H14DRAFT_161653 [Mycena olivaceomarginata]